MLIPSMPMPSMPESVPSMLMGICSVSDGAAAEGTGSFSPPAGAGMAGAAVAAGPRPGTTASSSAPTGARWVITDGIPSVFIAIRGRGPGVAA